MKRFKDIVLGSREPQYHDVLWIDTSTGDNVLKVFNSGWKELSPSDSEYEQLKQELLDQMEETATKVTNNIVAGAPEAMDTLKEVSDTILSNKESVDSKFNSIQYDIDNKLDNSTTFKEIKIAFNKDGTIVPNELEPVETDVVYRMGGTTLPVSELNLPENCKIYRTKPIKIPPHTYLQMNTMGDWYRDNMSRGERYDDVLFGYYCDSKGNYKSSDIEDMCAVANSSGYMCNLILENRTDDYTYGIVYLTNESDQSFVNYVGLPTNNAEKLKQASTDAAAALSGLDKKQNKAVAYTNIGEMEYDTTQEVGTIGKIQNTKYVTIYYDNSFLDVPLILGKSNFDDYCNSEDDIARTKGKIYTLAHSESGQTLTIEFLTEELHKNGQDILKISFNEPNGSDSTSYVISKDSSGDYEITEHFSDGDTNEEDLSSEYLLFNLEGLWYPEPDLKNLKLYFLYITEPTDEYSFYINTGYNGDEEDPNYWSPLANIKVSDSNTVSAVNFDNNGATEVIPLITNDDLERAESYLLDQISSKKGTHFFDIDINNDGEYSFIKNNGYNSTDAMLLALSDLYYNESLIILRAKYRNQVKYYPVVYNNVKRGEDDGPCKGKLVAVGYEDNNFIVLTVTVDPTASSDFVKTSIKTQTIPTQLVAGDNIIIKDNTISATSNYNPSYDLLIDPYESYKEKDPSKLYDNTGSLIDFAAPTGVDVVISNPIKVCVSDTFIAYASGTIFDENPSINNSIILGYISDEEGKYVSQLTDNFTVGDMLQNGPIATTIEVIIDANTKNADYYVTLVGFKSGDKRSFDIVGRDTTKSIVLQELVNDNQKKGIAIATLENRLRVLEDKQTTNTSKS